MSKQKIGWQVKEGSGEAIVIHRSFEDVTVNLFDTLPETIEFYKDDFVLDALNGTSIRVQIQNHLRARSTLKNDDGSWTHTDKDLIAYADTYVPSVSAAAQRKVEEYNNASPELKAQLDIERDLEQKLANIKRQTKALKGQQRPQSGSAEGKVVKDRKQS